MTNNNVISIKLLAHGLTLIHSRLSLKDQGSIQSELITPHIKWS